MKTSIYPQLQPKLLTLVTSEVISIATTSKANLDRLACLHPRLKTMDPQAVEFRYAKGS